MLNRAGYGRLRIAGRWDLAHRVAYILRSGPIADGLCVLHRCDNPCCVNPKHLFVGTKTDNALDRDRKNRQAKGDRHGMRRKKLLREAAHG